MNSDQIVSFIDKGITLAGGVAVTFGITDAATIGPYEAAAFAVVGGLAVLYGGLRSLWTHLHPAQSQAAARSIAADPNNPQVTGPVARALQDAGVTVTPTAITQAS